MQLRDAARSLARTAPPAPPRRRWVTKRRVALVLAVDLVLGSIAWHYLTESHPSAVAAAVQRISKDAAHNDWNAVYSQLCSSDRDQMSERELATAGQAALLQLGGLSHVTVTRVTPARVSVGPLPVPAAQAAGELVPELGPQSAYTVTLVESVGGWHVCLSVGGYSSAALGIAVPLSGTGSASR